MVRVRVPATTANMGPGFDTIGMALELYNYLEMDVIPSGLEFDISGEGSESIPRDETNVVYQAAVRVFEKNGDEPTGLKIKQENQIPASRGMGSSAAAIVAGMVAANELAGGKLTEGQLLELAVAMEGHPDNVAPAMLGGVVVSAVLDERLFYRKIKPPQQLSMVLAVPDFTLSTSIARDVLPLNVPVKDAVFNVSRASLLVLALIQEDYQLLGQMMDDKLHQPYRVNLVPGMQAVFDAAKRSGALAVALSGAGPALVAFVTDKDKCKLVGQSMRQAFSQVGVNCDTRHLAASPTGAQIERKGEWVEC
ncbi:homoserine kinase [Metallumcola ferriviriculae]|uniref:Homoserine kinase n=1 Tax=Metallumcola ferriviriculae TaxID=3039180 RepID=A0AAU0USX6_9FIRM|nr:homoserine kinase [Desulfitibacteraceae bacterium MK1]